MKLQGVRLTGYRSIKQSQYLLLDDKVTILIGANDHGKSNLLAAIRCLNDDSLIIEEDRNWDLPQDSPVEIEWEFEPSKDEFVVLKKNEMKVKIKKTKKVVEAVAEGQNEPVPVEVEIEEDQAEEASFAVNTDNKIIFYRDSKTNAIKVKSLPIKIAVSQESIILAMRPRVELFESPTGNVVDQVTLANLDDPSFEFMQGIFRLAGLWENRTTIFTQNAGTSKLLDEASNKLTKILNDKWNQGKDLVWKLKHTGTNGDSIIIEIQDPSIDTRYSRPSLRSSGFKTYFLLSMITLARKANKPAYSYLFLFDEPGTYLHPHAQLDLQRSFEAISDDTQLVYTTHSIFLINKNHPNRNRVISKHIDGTKIDQKPFLKNWKSVRDSLGILLSNNFLIAEKTLLVEGPSDVIYLLDVIKKLKSTGDIDIDLNDLSMVDAGNSQNYLAMAKLMLSEGRSVVALLDGDSAGDILEEQLKKACVLELKKKLLQIHKLPKDKSIEDITVDVASFRSSIKIVVDYLVSNSIRNLVNGIDPGTVINSIDFQSAKTLGLSVDEISKSWFDPNEKISKLSIALEYETLAQNANVNPAAKEQIEKIKELLKLRGEKSADKGVFEEVL